MINQNSSLSQSNILVTNDPYQCKDLFVITNNLLNLKYKKYKDLITSKDIIISSFKEDKSIESLRTKLEKFSLINPDKPKLFLIFELDKFSIESQNILLKTVEEPYENSYIIIITSNPEDLLETIKSRCQIIYSKDDIEISDLKNFNSRDDAFKELEKLLASTTDKRQKALIFIDKLTMSLKNTKNDDKHFFKKLKYIVKCKDYIPFNVNLRLCLENAIIEVYS